ncbi:MAG: recombinase family protein [Xanthobacteraceae bacterium]
MLDFVRAGPGERAILGAHPAVICTGPEAFSYLRVSTNAQLQGDGPRRTIAAADKVAKDRGLALNATLSLNDGGVSAFTGENLTSGALFAFCTLAKYGRIAEGSLLILDALDRFSRDEPLVAVGPYRDLLLAGIDLYTCSDNRFHDHRLKGMESAMMLMVSLMQFGVANQESSTKSYRIVESWIGRRQRANTNRTPMTTLCPGWLRYDERTGKFTPIPHRVNVVHRIFEMAAQGRGKRTIAKAFSHEPTWGLGKRAGRTFYESYVHKLLNDRRVLGEFQPGTKPKKPRSGETKRIWRPEGNPIPDYYPRTISDDLWWQVRYVRDKNKGRGGGNPEAFRSLFRGLTFCGCCASATGKRVGMAFVAKGKASRSFDKLVCSQAIRSQQPEKRKARGLPVCTHTRRYKYGALERHVIFGLGERARDLFGHENRRRADLEREAAMLEARIAELHKQEQKWLRAMDDDEAVPKVVLKKLALIEADLAAAEVDHQRRIAEVKATPTRVDVGRRLSELMAALKERETVEDRRRLNDHMRRLIKSILFCPNEDDTATIVTTFADGRTAKWFLPAAGSGAVDGAQGRHAGVLR